MNKIRVFLVDDSSVVRRLVTTALNRDADLEVVGTAADGQMALNRLDEVMPVFPPDWSVPILVVQHMPADFTARLAERLTEKSRLRVREGVAGEPVSAAQAWIAPGGYHLLLQEEGGTTRLALNQEPP